MSIATDEAENKFGDTYEDELTADFTHRRERNAYVAGRTAEPTDAEIKAAVRAMYYRHAADWESDEDYARHLLDAARKAVTE